MKLLLSLCLTILLFGCGMPTIEQVQQIKVGITEDSLIKVVGQPSRTEIINDQRIYVYNYRGGGTGILKVIIKADTVTEFYTVNGNQQTKDSCSCRHK